jgi:hypothetical protein
MRLSTTHARPHNVVRGRRQRRSHQVRATGQTGIPFGYAGSPPAEGYGSPTGLRITRSAGAFTEHLPNIDPHLATCCTGRVSRFACKELTLRLCRTLADPQGPSHGGNPGSNSQTARFLARTTSCSAVTYDLIERRSDYHGGLQSVAVEFNYGNANTRLS